MPAGSNEKKNCDDAKSAKTSAKISALFAHPGASRLKTLALWKPASHPTGGRAPVLLVALLAAGACTVGEPPSPEHEMAAREVPRAVAPEPGEDHFGDLLMLTDGGENAEAYFSPDGERLVFQSTRPPFGCDQIFVMDAGGSEPVLVSGGVGRTTCGYFLPDGTTVLYATTAPDVIACPPVPDHSRGYVWPLYPSYDIVTATVDGEPLGRLTDTPGYDAEATVSPAGDRIVFTSVRDGDLEIYSMNVDGSDVVRLTHEPGYDGGPFYSPDGSRIVYRARHPTDPGELADYRALLADGLIRPGRLEVWVMDADGSDKRQVTDLNGAAFAPFFHPSGEKIVFSSNHENPGGREFELYMVDVDGGNVERLTYSEGFDGFPMFSPDGARLVFASNRHNRQPGETNIFVTDWRE